MDGGSMWAVAISFRLPFFGTGTRCFHLPGTPAPGAGKENAARREAAAA